MNKPSDKGNPCYLECDKLSVWPNKIEASSPNQPKPDTWHGVSYLLVF